MNSDYFVVNPSKAPVRERGDNVGREHDALVSSLDQAMDQLSQVERQYLLDSELNLERAFAVIQLLSAIGNAGSRAAAVITVAEFLAEHGENVHVRFGIGAEILRSFGDRRLGWLKSESALFEEYSGRWNTTSELDSDQPAKNVSVTRISQEVGIFLQQPDGQQRIAFWIEGDGKQSENAFRWLEPVLQAIGDVLWSRPRRDYWKWKGKVGSRIARISTVAAVLASLFLIWPVSYRVRCEAKVDTYFQRMVAAPFDATLEQALVKPGEQVKAGQVLIRLDGRPLRLELDAVEAEIQEIRKEHDVALANRQIADSQQLALKRRRLDRKRDLISDRLSNLEITSPIDGVVISGDLEKFIGAPVERGQGMFEIAPLHTLQVELEIPDYEIGYVQRGAVASIKLDAIGGQAMTLKIEDIHPSAELRNDQNVFIAKVRAQNHDGALRPGMLGNATAYGPLRPRIWSLVRPAWERVLWWVGY